jgi:hypothetical protein
MCDLTNLEERLNFTTTTPSGRSNFTVSYEQGKIICTTARGNKIIFNREFPYDNTLASSVEFLRNFGDRGIKIGSCQGDPEENTFEAFLRQYGQPHRLGSYLPSILVELGCAEIFNQGRASWIRAI